jgi:hypothetical protein
VHTISHAVPVQEWLPAFFGQRTPVPERISQARQ